MVNDTDRFYHELKAYLESFPQREDLPDVPVTMTGIPREGLTVKYQHPSAGPVDPADLAGEAAKVIGAAGIGTAGGAVIGAVIGKVVLGGTLARIGVASAGAAIGIPILAPVALVGGAISTAAYAAYKIGKGKREQGNAEELLERLMEHMQGFNPSVKWPEIEVYVSVPETGLAAIWQPALEDGV
jgi:hypothetical protein